jgi:hypothetical protein
MSTHGEFLEITKMDSNGYTSPKVWTWNKDNGVQFAGNRPTAGATHEKMLPIGKHPLQLYSLALRRWIVAAYSGVETLGSSL